MIFPYKIETEIEKVPVFTIVMICANAAVFFILQIYPEEIRQLIFYDYGCIPENLSIIPLFTSLFIHAGWLHFLGNMYFLWLFGRGVEQRFSLLPCMLIYFGSGLAGNFLQVGFTPAYIADVPGIGASGAISGLLGAYVAFYPNDKIECIYISFLLRYGNVIKLPSILFLGSWFVLQFVNALWLSSVPGGMMVAFWAHVGGFLFGALTPVIFVNFAVLVRRTRRHKLLAALEDYSDFVRRENYEKATETLIKTLRIHPGDPLALCELGKLEMRKKNVMEGIKLFTHSFEAALRKKEDARAVCAYLSLAATGKSPLTNSHRLIVGRRFARLKKYGHALGVLAGAFTPGAAVAGLDALLYEIGEIFAGPLDDYGRAQAAYGLVIELFPHSPLSKEAEYRLRKQRAKGKTVFG